MKILYLYTEVMGYTMATIKELCERYGTEVHIVHWDKGKLTPFRYENINNVYFYSRSEYPTNSIKNLVKSINPDLAVVSGWQDKGYLPAARLLRKRGIPVVLACDGQWYGNIRQYIATLFRFLLNHYFSHAWIAGPYQFEFVKRLRFKKHEIIFNLYSADQSLFNNAYYTSFNTKKKNYPHRFLFVGRFEKIKGIDLLAEAWQMLGNTRKDWELFCIGNGSLAGLLRAQPGIVTIDFLQPEQLVTKILDAGCFILPSRGEPWGVVIHEFASAGLPLICSDVCGAAPVFIIHGLNGFLFQSGNINSLCKSMLAVINSTDEQLLKMCECSNNMGQHISPALSAASLMSIAG